MKYFSGNGRFVRRIRLGLVAGAAVLLCVGHAFAGPIWLNGSAFGGYGSGNTTLGHQSVSGVALADDDTTGLQQAQNYHISAGSTGNSFLTGNAISATGGHLVASDYPNDPLNYNFSSGGGVQYLDSITVASPTEPAGTMVTVQFSLEVAYSAAANHSLAGQYDSGNYSMAKGYVSAFVSGWSDSHYVDPNLNKVIIDTYDLDNITAGLFTGAQHLNFVIDAEVGEEISFSLTVDADTQGDVRMYTLDENVLNGVGTAYSTVAVAFGATVISSEGGVAEEFELQSQRMGQNFPSAAIANAVAAQFAMPSNVYVPEPSTLMMLAVGSLGLLAFARRRSLRPY